MKKFIKKNKIHLLIALVFLILIIASFLFDYNVGKEIFKTQFLDFLKEMMMILPAMFILIGLGDVWISKEKVQKAVGNKSGFKGILFIVLLSMAQAGPLYSAFPVAYLLWKKGASIRNIFIYLGVFCTIKIPMLAFEIGFLGWKFSLLRALFSFPVIILIAIIMEKYLKNKKFKINSI